MTAALASEADVGRAGAAGVLGALLRRSADGELAAFMEFYDATSAAAYRYALCARRDAAVAEEETAGRYLAAWRRCAEHPASGLSPVAWLLSLTAERGA